MVRMLYTRSWERIEVGISCPRRARCTTRDMYQRCECTRLMFLHFIHKLGRLLAQFSQAMDHPLFCEHSIRELWEASAFKRSSRKKLRLLLVLSAASAALDECSVQFGPGSFCNSAGVCENTLDRCEDVYNSIAWVEPLPYRTDGCLHSPSLLVDYDELQDGTVTEDEFRIMTFVILKIISPTARELIMNHCNTLEDSLTSLSRFLLDGHRQRPMYVPSQSDDLIRSALTSIASLVRLSDLLDTLAQSTIRRSINHSQYVRDYIVLIDELLSVCLEKEVVIGCAKALVPYTYLATTIMVQLGTRTPLLLNMLRPMRMSYFLSAIQFDLTGIDPSPSWVYIVTSHNVHLLDSFEVPLFHSNPPGRSSPVQTVPELLNDFERIFQEPDPPREIALEVVWKLLLLGDSHHTFSEFETQIFCMQSNFVHWILNRSELRYAIVEMRTRRIMTVFFRICKEYVGQMPIQPRVSIVRARMVSNNGNKRDVFMLSCDSFDEGFLQVGGDTVPLQRMGYSMLWNTVRVNLSTGGCAEFLMREVIRSSMVIASDRFQVSADMSPGQLRTIGRLLALLLLHDDPGNMLNSIIDARKELFVNFKDIVSLGHETVLKGFCDLAACSILFLALPTADDVIKYMRWSRDIIRPLGADDDYPL